MRDMRHDTHSDLTSTRSRFLLMISLLTSVSIIINIKFPQMQRRAITKMSRDQVYNYEAVKKYRDKSSI